VQGGINISAVVVVVVVVVIQFALPKPTYGSENVQKLETAGRSVLRQAACLAGEGN